MQRSVGGALLALFATFPTVSSADTYPRQPGIDVVHYVFRLRFTEASNEISGDATITMKITAPNVSEAYLDLTSAASGKGMSVSKVTVANSAVKHTHEANRLRISLPPSPAGAELSVNVVYTGTPTGGLRLGENIHGERTVFSENWPDNARHWLPMVDHPYDKATGEFVVTAPAYFQVVANGQLVEEVDLPGNERRTHWRQSVPISSWLYALGLARFAVHHYDVVRGIPLQVWSFPQDRDKAYELFEFTGRRAFEYFSDWIGPYSYEKLAHVEAARHERRVPSTRRRSSTENGRHCRPRTRSCTKSRTSGGETRSPRRTGTTSGSARASPHISPISTPSSSTAAMRSFAA